MTFESLPARLPSIAIVGGGLAARMASAALAQAYGAHAGAISLIDAPAMDFPVVASLPTLRLFNEKLGISEKTFRQKTGALTSLGTKFTGWAAPEHSFFHPFGSYGTDIGTAAFHHCWLKARALGDATPLADYSLASALAAQDRFAYPSRDAASVLSSYSYSHHFDAALYARLLADHAPGAVRKNGALVHAVLGGEDGFIEKLVLEGGEEIRADLYLDCTDGLLIEDALKTGYEDWSRWLPCDRVIVAQSGKPQDAHPYTQIMARDAGWQWQTAMRGGVSHGYVHCARFAGDAKEALLARMDGAPLAEPARFSFINGRRRKFWNKNCVALGAAAGFLEPLEGTHLHLIQNGIARLLQLLPAPAGDPACRAEYDRLLGAEHRQIRDFLILHYHANGRADSAFWRDCRAMEIPESLAARIALFRARGRVAVDGGEIFSLPNWLSIYEGLGIRPQRYHPFVDDMPVDDLKKSLQAIRAAIRQAANAMPDYRSFALKQEQDDGA